jgi:hypothetical protein
VQWKTCLQNWLYRRSGGNPQLLLGHGRRPTASYPLISANPKNSVRFSEPVPLNMMKLTEESEKVNLNYVELLKSVERQYS